MFIVADTFTFVEFIFYFITIQINPYELKEKWIHTLQSSWVHGLFVIHKTSYKKTKLLFKTQALQQGMMCDPW